MKTRLLGLVFAFGLLVLPVLASASPMDGTYTGSGAIDTGTFLITLDPYTAVIGAETDVYSVDYTGAYLPSADILATGPYGDLGTDGFTIQLLDSLNADGIPYMISFESAAAEFTGTALLTFSDYDADQNLFMTLALWAEGTSSLFNNANITVSGTLERAATPLPAAVWLLGTGLVGLVGLKRKRGKM